MPIVRFVHVFLLLLKNGMTSEIMDDRFSELFECIFHVSVGGRTCFKQASKLTDADLWVLNISCVKYEKLFDKLPRYKS